MLALAPHDVLAAFLADPSTPRGHSQAMKMNREMWGEAERKELKAHQRNHSWMLTDPMCRSGQT